MATVVPRLKKRRLSPDAGMPSVETAVHPMTTPVLGGLTSPLPHTMLGVAGPSAISSPLGCAHPLPSTVCAPAPTAPTHAYLPAQPAMSVPSPHAMTNPIRSPLAVPAVLSSPHAVPAMLSSPHHVSSTLSSPHVIPPALGSPHTVPSALCSPHAVPSYLGMGVAPDVALGMLPLPPPQPSQPPPAQPVPPLPPRKSVREMIGGQERQVYLISSDEEDDEDDAPPASPLLNPPPVVAAPKMSKRKRGADDAPVKRQRAEPVAEPVPIHTFAPLTTYPAPLVLNGPALGSKPRLYNDAWGEPPPPPPLDTVPTNDKDGHIIVREGECLTPRYQICGLLGQGTFGKVVKCYDRKLRRSVAIKVIRAVQKYRDASQIEIRVLRYLRQNDPMNENKCIQLLETFDFCNHVCIVSDLLDRSVFDFLKDNHFQPFPCRNIWSFAYQLMKSVAFLHRLSLIHTDLKPENVLLVDASYDIVPTSRRSNARRKRVLRNSDIRLIDFGSATFSDEYHSGVVSTRHYRAPEIILGMGWSYPCDVWSLGCILVEFYTGDALFQTHDNLEHLAMMEMVLGRLPDDYRRKAETYKPEYFRNGQLDYPRADTSKQSRRYVYNMKRIHEIVAGPSAYAKHNELFVSLLRRMLDFDPARRITVQEALQHPYFALQPHEIPP